MRFLLFHILHFLQNFLEHHQLLKISFGQQNGTDGIWSIVYLIVYILFLWTLVALTKNENCGSGWENLLHYQCLSKPFRSIPSDQSKFTSSTKHLKNKPLNQKNFVWTTITMKHLGSSVQIRVNILKATIKLRCEREITV